MSYVSAGTVILVTGATGGIGIEIARQAVAQGATVAVHGSRMERVEEAMALLHRDAPEAKLIAVPGDFREAGVIDAVVARVVAEAGRLDAVIHCAITGAGNVNGIFTKTDPKSYGLMAQYTLGIFEQLCFAAVAHMSPQGSGAIVAFISDAGRFAAARQSILAGVFGGIVSFVRSLALEVGREGVRVNCISPSYVLDTPVFERVAISGRGDAAAKRASLGLPSPKDIAPLALFLCGPDSAKITGQIISVNGGLNA